jgi:hypothetical protein
VLLILASVAPAAAQRVELSGTLGFTISDGVDGDGVLAGDGNIYNEVDVADGVSWGFGVGFLATENVEVGFLFNQQMSRLDIKGTNTVELGDMNVNSYHGYVAYNFGDIDSPVRPYVLGGIGATSYGNVSFVARGITLETSGETQYSSTWGAGVKFLPNRGIGGRVGVSWTPTYIKSDAEGWWCDPYWGCYVVGDAQYSNQLQFQGGVTIRF